MKIYLDLLPEGRKEEIRKKKLFKSMIHQEIRLLFPVIFFVGILAVINYNIKSELKSIEQYSSAEQSQEEYKELKKYEEKFRDTNIEVASEINYQDKHLYWSNIFKELSGLIPDGMYLSNLSNADYKVTILGKAKTRDDLLLFQEKVKVSDCFANINIPLPNLVNKDNISFQIDFDVKSNCLQSK